MVNNYYLIVRKDEVEKKVNRVRISNKLGKIIKNSKLFIQNKCHSPPFLGSTRHSQFSPSPLSLYTYASV